MKSKKLNELIERWNSEDDGVDMLESHFMICQLISDREKAIEVINLFKVVLTYYSEKPIFGQEAKKALEKYEEITKVE